MECQSRLFSLFIDIENSIFRYQKCIFRYRKLFFDIDNLTFRYQKFIYRYWKIPTFMDIEKSFFDIEKNVIPMTHGHLIWHYYCIVLNKCSCTWTATLGNSGSSEQHNRGFSVNLCSNLTNFPLFWGKYSIRKCWARLFKHEHLLSTIRYTFYFTTLPPPNTPPQTQGGQTKI